MPNQQKTIGPCTLINGDCLKVLRELESESVNCVVTSPPYWGLRDYGTAQWEGGGNECDHISGKSRQDTERPYGTKEVLTEYYKNICKKCGAKRIDQQVGSEQTPDEFVAKMVEVFSEIKRVLKDDGTCWLNLGDSYSGGIKSSSKSNDGVTSKKQMSNKGGYRAGGAGLPSGNLVGIPWRVALALQTDGWILRSDIIWHKPNPMPESVKNRCTKSHEYIFLLVKKSGYYYYQEAISEFSTQSSISRLTQNIENQQGSEGPFKINGPMKAVGGEYRNKRSVWTVPTQSSKEPHYATFPVRLIDPCIKAGCPKDGIVLDPFSGLATTGIVCIRNYCNYIGIELSEKYHEIACRRIKRKWDKDNAGFFRATYSQRPETNTPKKHEGFK